MAELSRAHTGGPALWLENGGANSGAANINDTANTYPTKLLPFFGPRPPASPDDALRANRPFEAYFLPDAYKGRNDYLSSTLVEILLSGNSFITSRCLPMMHRDDPNIRWSTMKFDSTLVDYEAEQGVPRLITSRSATYQDFMSRRGIAFLINHGFANTPAGQMDFFYKFSAMATAMQETLDQEGILAIINCKNEYPSITSSLPEALRIGGMEPVQCFRTAVDQWGMIQKGERAFVHLDEIVKAAMSREGVYPDTWLVPPGMRSYVTLEPAESEYFRAGPAARTNLRQGEHALDSWRGTQVFEVKDYHLDTGDVYINNFVRDRMVGDYFVIRDFAYGRYAGTEDLKKVRHMRYQTDAYCCDTDTWENFTLSDALKHCGVWNSLGDFTSEFMKYVQSLDGTAPEEKFSNANNPDGRRSGAELAAWIYMVDNLYRQGNMSYGVLQAQCARLGYMGKNAYIGISEVDEEVRNAWTSVQNSFGNAEIAIQAGDIAGKECKKHVSHLSTILSSAPTADIPITQRTHSGHRVAVRKTGVLAKASSQVENYSSALLTTLTSFIQPGAPSPDGSPVSEDGLAHGLLYTLLNVPLMYNGAVTDAANGKVSQNVSQSLKDALQSWIDDEAPEDNNDYNVLQNTTIQTDVTISASDMHTKRKEVTSILDDGAPMCDLSAYTTADMLQLFYKDLCFALNQILINMKEQYMAEARAEYPMQRMQAYIRASIFAASKVEFADLAEQDAALGSMSHYSKHAREYQAAFQDKLLRAENAMINLSNICLMFYVLCSLDLGPAYRETMKTGKTYKSTKELIMPTGPLGYDFGIDTDQEALGTLMLHVWRRSLFDRSNAGYKFYSEVKYDTGKTQNANTVKQPYYTIPKQCYHGKNGAGLTQNGLSYVVNSIKTLYANMDGYDVAAVHIDGNQWERLIGKKAEALTQPWKQPFYETIYYQYYNGAIADKVMTELKNLQAAVIAQFGKGTFPQGSALVHIIEKLKGAVREFAVGYSDDADDLAPGDMDSKEAEIRSYMFEIQNGLEKGNVDLINCNTFDTFYKYLTDPSGWTNDERMDDFPPPLSVVCTRPFKTYQMGSAVLMQSGKETGFTAHGHEDVQVGDDCIAHTHVCHFTGWYASVITNPKRIAIAADVYCMAYERGESRNFFDHEKWTRDTAPHDPLTHLREDQENKSIIAFLAPYGAGCKRFECQLAHEDRLPTPLDISGTYSQCKVNTRHDKSSMPCPALNQYLWNCNVIADGQLSVEEIAEQAVTWDAVPICNLTCFSTTQRILGGSVNSAIDNTAIILGQDHFGPDFTGPGAAKGRNGGTGGLLGFKRFNHESNYTVIQ